MASGDAREQKHRVSLNTTQLFFSGAMFMVLFVDVSSSLVWPLAVGIACTYREIVRYENALSFTPTRALYFLFWTLPAPFTMPPYKPILAHLVAEPYSHSYKHFKSGHQGTVNLSLHVVALVVSLLTQFALMARIPIPFTAELALISWCAVLASLGAPCSATIKAAALASVISGYVLSHYLASLHWSWLYIGCWLSLQAQALSHTLTREVPTLATLPTISGEVAHTVYFPALLSHAIIDAISAKEVTSKKCICEKEVTCF